MKRTHLDLYRVFHKLFAWQYDNLRTDTRLLAVDLVENKVGALGDNLDAYMYWWEDNG